MQPDDAVTNLAYGFWLWQFGDEMGKGLGLVKRARRLDPNSVATIATLGAMYSNPSGNCYDIQDAERALRLAIQLDPSYAYPRWMLLSLLGDQKRFPEAKAQLDAYISMIPKESATSPAIAQMKERFGRK